MAGKSFNVVERVSVYNPLYPFYAETSMRLKRGLKTDQDHAIQASSFLHNVARRTSVCVCDHYTNNHHVSGDVSGGSC